LKLPDPSVAVSTKDAANTVRFVAVIHDSVSAFAIECAFANAALESLSFHHLVKFGFCEFVLFENSLELMSFVVVFLSNLAPPFRILFRPIAATFIVAFDAPATVAAHRLVEVERSLGTTFCACFFSRFNH
jgi:hypothetical protein